MKGLSFKGLNRQRLGFGFRVRCGIGFRTFIDLTSSLKSLYNLFTLLSTLRYKINYNESYLTKMCTAR